MSEKKISEAADNDSESFEFTTESPFGGSSEALAGSRTLEAPVMPETAATDEPERSPAFKLLAEPELPRLEKENRARLLMQTPNRLFFYWSAASNPYNVLDRALADRGGNYSLILKLVDVSLGSETIHPVEPEGSWWFDVRPDGEYRAEIGLYSPSRPYIRIMYSNVVHTPRKSPSGHAAETSEWRISADKFAKVLDVAGFKRDAFEVALAGEDPAASARTTQAAFADLLGVSETGLDAFSAEELRYALLALAAGQPLESLRWQIGASLFALLQKHAAYLSALRAAEILKDRFDVEPSEFLEEEEGAEAVYGASLVNFPRRLRYRPLRNAEPVSSFHFG